MAIKKRTSVQTPGKKHNLRHPLLKPASPTLMLYNYIRDNPGCSTSQLRALYPSGQPVSNMLDEGLIRNVAEGKGHGNARFEVVPENSTGQGRDRVEVEIILFVNDFGEYSINARMIGQHLTAHDDRPRELLRKNVVIRPPMPGDPYAARPMIDVNDLQLSAMPKPADFLAPEGSLQIDGDYSIIEDTNK